MNFARDVEFNAISTFWWWNLSKYVFHADKSKKKIEYFTLGPHNALNLDRL